jgi:hypothetical protein
MSRVFPFQAAQLRARIKASRTCALRAAGLGRWLEMAAFPRTFNRNAQLHKYRAMRLSALSRRRWYVLTTRRVGKRL